MNGNSQFDWLDEGCLQEGARLKFNLCCCFQYNNTPYVWQGDTHRSLLSWVAKGCEICWTNIMSLQNWWKNEGGALELSPSSSKDTRSFSSTSPKATQYDDVMMTSLCTKQYKVSVRLYVRRRCASGKSELEENGIRAGLQWRRTIWLTQRRTNCVTDTSNPLCQPTFHAALVDCLGLSSSA